MSGICTFNVVEGRVRRRCAKEAKHIWQLRNGVLVSARCDTHHWDNPAMQLRGLQFRMRLFQNDNEVQE